MLQGGRPLARCISPPRVRIWPCSRFQELSTLDNSWGKTRRRAICGLWPSACDLPPRFRLPSLEICRARSPLRRSSEFVARVSCVCRVATSHRASAHSDSRLFLNLPLITNASSLPFVGCSRSARVTLSEAKRTPSSPDSALDGHEQEPLPGWSAWACPCLVPSIKASPYLSHGRRRIWWHAVAAAT